MMALDQSALLGLLGELRLIEVSDRIRVATEKLYQELIDAEAAAVIGAAPYQRTPEWVTQRNGTRFKTLTTTAGQLDLPDPETAVREFLSLAAGTTPPGRSGPVRGGDGGLCLRRVNQEGR